MVLTSRATHVLQWVVQWAIPQGGGNPQNHPQYRLQSATRLHEAGIASNRRSACCGEYVPGPCTHRPSNHGSWGRPKSLMKRLRWTQWLGLSRNKVAVPEGAAGSPPLRRTEPFFIERSTPTLHFCSFRARTLAACRSYFHTIFLFSSSMSLLTSQSSGL